MSENPITGGSILAYPPRQYQDIRVVEEKDLAGWFNRDDFELIAILPCTRLEPAQQPPSAGQVSFKGNAQNFGWSQTSQGQNFAAPSIVAAPVPQPTPLTHVVYYKYLFGKSNDQVIKELRNINNQFEINYRALDREMDALRKQHESEIARLLAAQNDERSAWQEEVRALTTRLQECHPDSVVPFEREKPVVLEGLPEEAAPEKPVAETPAAVCDPKPSATESW